MFYSKPIFVEMSTIKPATESTTNYEKKSTEKSMESTTVYVKASEEKTTKFTTMSTSTSMSTATKSSAASEQATKIVYNSSNTAKTKKALTIAGKQKNLFISIRLQILNIINLYTFLRYALPLHCVFRVHFCNYFCIFMQIKLLGFLCILCYNRTLNFT